MKAIIHIGLPKAGSSSIQEFLSINRDALIERGIRHAPYDPSKGSQFELPVTALDLVDKPVPESPPRAILGLHTTADRVRYAQAYTAWLDDGLARWNEPLFVASSEHLQPWLNGAATIGALDSFLSARFTSVRYVLYLRRQADLIVSAYSERVRRGETMAFEAHMERRFKALNLFAIVQRWEKVVSADRLDVRLLAPGTPAGDDLIADFCTVLGTSPDGLTQPRRMNSALSAEQIALRLRLSRWLRVRRPDGRYNPWYFGALRLLGRGLPKPGTRLTLTEDQRQRVEAHFAASNEALRQHRFPDRPTLF
jgi:hypothetical protein